MWSARRIDCLIYAALLCAFLSGCLFSSDATRRREQRITLLNKHVKREDTFTVYFFRDTSYKGLGRFHEFQIDGNRVGDLSADNFFRLELWPGEYIFTVYLPEEDFLGIKSPAETTSIRLVFGPSSPARTLLYKYVDGTGIYRVAADEKKMAGTLTATRTLSANLSARDTAQVKSLFDTRYDGPAKQGKTHGIGTLTWNDGSVFRGRFEYGHITDEGKFFRSDGQIYLGPTSKGRPNGPGVLTTEDGTILYSGKFKNETPHGIGIRLGEEGPEFCVFEDGKDVTKSIWQLTHEAVEEDEKEENRIENEEAKPDNSGFHYLEEVALNKETSEILKQGPNLVNASIDIDISTDSNSTQEKPEELVPGEKADKQPSDTPATMTREERISAKYKEIKLKIQEQIEEKRTWCIEEFDLGHHLCICAPFASDFDSWNGCRDR